jgi:hypothetical protein
VELEKAGWAALRFWEHEVFEGPEELAVQILAVVRGKPARRGSAPRVCAVDFVDTDGDIERRHLVTLRGNRQLGSEVARAANHEVAGPELTVRSA